MSRFAPRALALLLALVAVAMVHPRDGGSVRLYYPGEPWDPMPAGLQSPADLILSGAVFSVLSPARTGGLLVGLEEAPDGDRWSLHLDPLARFPDGRRVTPEDVIRSWEELLLTPGSRHRFLLEPVLGARAFLDGDADHIEGLEARGDELVITASRPVPDLWHRLVHPALAVGTTDRLGAPLGPGPFQPDRRGAALGGNPYHHRGSPFLDGFSLITDEGIDPALLVEAGEAQAAILFGRAAGSLIDRATDAVRLERAPGWDRVYALCLNATVLKEVGVRQALDRSVDRGRMVRLLFDGRGAPVRSLLPVVDVMPAEAPGPGDPARGRRIVLSFDATDAMAVSIGARVKAAWENAGFSIDLDGLEPPELEERLARGEHAAALVLHQGMTADPVLALRGALGSIAPDAARVSDALRAAELLTEEGARSEAALTVEANLVADRRLIPLVRLHAWLATDPRLVGIRGHRSAQPGLLRLDDAFFLP